MKYTGWIFFFVLVSGLTALGDLPTASPDVTSGRGLRQAGTIEVIYRWQEPLNVVDEAVYERLKQTLSQANADYYYAMYARSKDDILISQVRYKVNQVWIPTRILLDGKEIKYEEYIKLIELSPPGKYHLIYYQSTADGLLKLGEQPAGSRAFISDVRFVPKVASAVGKSTAFSLWHFAGIAIVGWGLIEYQQKTQSVPPTASFQVIPQIGTLSTDFYVDASASHDPYQSAVHLQVRWDWENNGIWDTSFSVDKTASHTYTSTGTYTIKLQVIDGVYTSTTTAGVTVINDGFGLMPSPNPMFHYCLTHTGLSPYQGAVTNTVKWYYQTGGKVQSSPAIDDNDNIYASSYDGILYKILPTSATDWTYAVGGIVHSSPAIASDGTIYVGSGDGKLHAVNRTTGSKKWTYPTGDWLKSSPAIAPDGTVYIGSINGNLYAINYDGSLKWVRSLGSWIESSPAVGSDGTIYIGTEDGKLYAVNPNSTIKWSYPTGGPVYSSPAVAPDGTIYFGSGDTYLYALYPNGQLRWRYKTGGPIFSSPAIGADGKIYIGSNDGKVYAVNSGGSAAGGSWPYTTGDSVYSSPVIGSNGTIYIGSDDKKLHAISPTGKASWTPVDIDSAVRSTPVIGDSSGGARVIYVGANNNRLYAIGVDPLDPAFLRITKQANKQQVSVGDMITYEITVTNHGAPPVPGATIETLLYDRIPAGFKYIKGSTILEGDKVDDPDGYKSRNLLFDIGVVALNETKTLSYQLVVGSGVTFGKYENKAYCKYRDPSNPSPPAPYKTSNTVRETVLVVPDPLFDLGTIIGKVFNDKNGNGVQDKGEEGIEGAKIVTEEGVVVTTDRNGKYHIPGVTPGTHLLKLEVNQRTKELKDERTSDDSLVSPSFSSSVAKVVRVTEGLLVKVNFGIRRHESGVVSSETDTKRKTQDAQRDSFTLVALGDGELGYSCTKGKLEPVKNDDRFEDGWYSKGRLAYYLKAKVKGKYLITSSLDTNRKNKELFRYIDPDKYYPVYGDASEINFDATNTQGPLYLLVEHLPSDSSLLWGNYHTGFNQTELASYNRTLYGAKLLYKQSDTARTQSDTTSQKDDTAFPASVTLFAAQAHQVATHNELRATGGSLYYLKHQNIIEGSEKVTLEMRDKITLQTISKSSQEAGVDYEIDYNNGRIIFTKPIASVESTESIISTGLLDGNPVYVVVDYEYQPDRMHFNKGTYGGRLRLKPNIRNTVSWVPDFSLGTTYVKEEESNKDYELKGVDTALELPYNTTLTAEYAKSVSYGIPNHLSTDGGLTFEQISPTVKPEGSAYGLKVSTAPKVFKGVPSQIDAYYNKIKPGFISSGTITQQGTEKYGATVKADLNRDLSITASYDIQELIESGNLASQNQIGADRTDTALLQGQYTFDPWKFTTEYRYQGVDDAIKPIKSETNYETEVAAVRIERDNFFNGILSAYLEQQVTLEGERNHQTTLGASTEVFEPLSFHLQGTSGTKGNASLVGFQTKLSAFFSLFSNYQQSHDTVEGNMATRSTGAMFTPNKDLRIYTQHEYKTSDQSRSSGLVLGMDKQISPGWYWGGNFEKSQIANLNQTETERYSASSRLNYYSEELNFSSKLEARFDEGGTADKDQYLAYNSLGCALNDSIYLSTRLNWSETLNQAQDRIEALFREYGIGLAYRPIEFDRINFLAKYSFLVDYRPLGQDDTSRTRANVYALEGAYDISRYFQIVEKIATKIGKEEVPPRDWQRSQTDLWINRINYHLTDPPAGKAGKITIGGEYRILKQHLADDKKQGFLVEAIYKASDYIQLGIGYNFTDFSDDLTTNNDYSARGPFIRFLATVWK